MIILDKALHERETQGKPVRVGMIGAGFMGRGLANQIINSVPGMRMSAIFNRTLATAQRAYNEAGIEDVVVAETVQQLEAAIDAGKAVITENEMLLAEAGNLDVLVEVTGAIEFGAHIVMHSIKHGKHMILMNAELDGTVGPILKTYADKAGVVLSGSDGDQPGVEMNLYRFVKGMGMEPLVCGNIKGLQDPYRNPTTKPASLPSGGKAP
jgi:predicted homoserine dehydrogenase-like protein